MTQPYGVENGDPLGCAEYLMLEAAIDDFANVYVMVGEDGEPDHHPTDHEQDLLRDALRRWVQDAGAQELMQCLLRVLPGEAEPGALAAHETNGEDT